jgi:glycolate oxidase
MIEAAVIEQLRGALGREGSLKPLASRDLAESQPLPNLALSPETTAEVAAILRIANQARVPVWPTGRNTNQAPDRRGIVVCTARLDRLCELDTANLTAEVEAGLSLAAFRAAVEDEGLYFPPDPFDAAGISMGSAAALDASGPGGVKYGSIKDYVLGLEVVLADGTIVRMGSKTVKNASGYNLTNLLVGSEGTLGVITKVMVRLLPLSQDRRTVVATFSSLKQATLAAAAALASRLIPATLEIVGNGGLAQQLLPQAVVAPRGSAVLLAAIDGSTPGVEHQVERLNERLGQNGALALATIGGRDEANLWCTYRAEIERLIRAAEPSRTLSVALPPHLLAPFVARLDSAGSRWEAIVHWGEGIVRLVLPDGVEAAPPEVVRAVAVLGGSIDGKPASVSPTRQQGAASEVLMRGLKAAFDPRGILSPGSIFDATQQEHEIEHL